jgi:hypothetical protein
MVIGASELVIVVISFSGSIRNESDAIGRGETNLGVDFDDDWKFKLTMFWSEVSANTRLAKLEHNKKSNITVTNSIRL